MGEGGDALFCPPHSQTAFLSFLPTLSDFSHGVPEQVYSCIDRILKYFNIDCGITLTITLPITLSPRHFCLLLALSP